VDAGFGCWYGQSDYYSQNAYYSQTTYYSQSTYYSEGTYYSQSGYYAESGYYSQSYYQSAYWNGGTYTFEYEPNGYCVRVTVIKGTSHPRTIIRSDGFSVACSEIEISARALQRSVELTY